MQSFASPLIPSLLLRVSAALLCLFLGACSQPDLPPPGTHASSTRAAYIVHFGVTRLKDHSSLASVNVPLRLGQTAVVRTGSKLATEEKPALPEFAATLTGTKTPACTNWSRRLRSAKPLATGKASSRFANGMKARCYRFVSAKARRQAPPMIPSKWTCTLIADRCRPCLPNVVPGQSPI